MYTDITHDNSRSNHDFHFLPTHPHKISGDVCTPSKCPSAKTNNFISNVTHQQYVTQHQRQKPSSNILSVHVDVISVFSQEASFSPFTAISLCRVAGLTKTFPSQTVNGPSLSPHLPGFTNCDIQHLIVYIIIICMWLKAIISFNLKCQFNLIVIIPHFKLFIQIQLFA